MDEKLKRAIDFMAAAVVEPDEVRRQFQVRTSTQAHIEIVRLRTGAVAICSGRTRLRRSTAR